MKEKNVHFGNCAGLMNSQFSKKGILLYNGFFGDMDESYGLFRDYIPLLHKQGFSTLRFNLTGLGGNRKDLERVTVQTWVEDTYQALDFFHTQGIEQIGIVGFSLGATYAILNYSRNPEIKSKIVGLALWAPAFNPRVDVLDRYKQNGDYEKSCVGTLTKFGKPVSAEVLDSLDFDVLTELENVDCPILICHSEQDPFIPLKTSLAVEKKIQHLNQLFVLNKTGHSFRSLEDPKDNSPRIKVYNKTLDFFRHYFE
ncbi:MAG: alpha/beta hydrolase [Nanoarchaeota archaeon]|nr:alpha/beta hydrolase [Nanoarchaeota archaeon]